MGSAFYGRATVEKGGEWGGLGLGYEIDLHQRQSRCRVESVVIVGKEGGGAKKARQMIIK